jgi:hypothetical protein
MHLMIIVSLTVEIELAPLSPGRWLWIWPRDPGLSRRRTRRPRGPRVLPICIFEDVVLLFYKCYAAESQSNKSHDLATCVGLVLYLRWYLARLRAHFCDAAASRAQVAILSGDFRSTTYRMAKPTPNQPRIVNHLNSSILMYSRVFARRLNHTV